MTMRRLTFSIIFATLFLVPALTLASTSVSVSSLNPSGTVSVGANVSFAVSTSGFSNATFSISDSFSGSSVSASNINSSGSFSWTPTASDAGSHNITVTVSDSSGNASSVSENITVANGPTIMINSLLPGYTVVAGTPLTFNVVTSGFSNPLYAIGESFGYGVSSLSTGDMSSNGYFSWTPTTNDIGSHTLTITVVDSSGHSVSQQLAITVSAPQVTVRSLTPGGTVASGQQLSFQIVPTGFTNPWFVATDSFFNTTFPNGQMSSNVTWVPALRDVGSHTITIAALDNYNHAATDTITIAVTQGSGTSGTIITTAPVSASSIISPPVVVSTPPTPFTSQTTPSTAPTFTSALATGSSGTQVTALQTLLARLGFFSTTANGYFGPATKAAVEAFQTAHNLDAVGSVGPQTRALLNQAQNSASYTFTTQLSLGSQGLAVTALQQRLTAEGDFSGQITGYFGAQTEAALKKFQTAHSLEAVGITGPQTRALLNK